MQIYLVGGAVRDQLLGLPVKDRDWVVTGATPEQMISKGFKPVGKSFPVFLHPKTGEEYALARKERKQGHGYKGFICDFDPSISLEEDLIRRDLTINSIAMDSQGKLIDPNNGQQDLKNRVLRHASAAFSEDPLRVLRAARFLAKLNPLGFSVHPDTLELLNDISESGELNHLTAERIWQEMERALHEPSPLQFFLLLKQCNGLERLIPELDPFFSDTGSSEFTALSNAIKKLSSAVSRWGALFYYSRQTNLTRRMPSKKIEKEQINVIEQLCNRLKIPNAYRQIAKTVTKISNRISGKTQLTSETILSIFETSDAIRQPEPFNQALEVCDAISTINPSLATYHSLLNGCRTITAKPFVKKGLKGPEIGSALKEARMSYIEKQLFSS